MQQKFKGYFERSINLNLYFLLVSCPTESLKVKKTFSAYMEEHANLRTICEEGKGKLQWERDIPQDDLGNYIFFQFGHTKGLSIYDGLLMMSRLHRFGCFFVPPIFESYK